eukprot:gb/GECG01006384.1/.p1 GENE.gb/GECG01006384.1/~~gb/GECG01006384.1/.p1  ORF type:complete len:1125 (+),score=117.90 gb/GECG01006384.1/:1-3375(+)
MTLSALKSGLNTHIDTENPAESRGLSSETAQDKLAQDGPNRLTPPHRKPEWLKFLLHLTNMFMLMLLGAALLSLVAFLIDRDDELNLYLCLVLVFIVLLNTTIGYFQERHSGEVMGSFSKMMAQQCRVIRGGKQVRIPVEELVKGDIVLVQGGDRVPADLRIIQSNKLKVEASSVTGESAPIQCTVEATSDIPLHSKNLAFNSALCVEGDAIGVVIRTGDDTMIGLVAKLAGGEASGETTLQREISRFVKFIAALALSMAVVLFVIGIGRGFDVLDTFVIAFIAILVANIPQGLPATVTTALTIAAKKMQKRSVFVKRLDAVETLGAASVICSDKTGTLTQNLMSLQNFWFDGSFEMLDGSLILDTSNLDTSSSNHVVFVNRPAVKSLEYINGKTTTGSNRTDSLGLHRVSFDVQGSELSGTAQHWYGHHLEPMLLVSTVCNQAVFSGETPRSAPSHRSIRSVGSIKINRLPSGSSAHPYLGRGHTMTLPHRRQSRRTQLTAMDLARRSESMKVFNKPVSELPPPPEGMVSPQPSFSAGTSGAPPTILGNASDAALLRYCDQIAPAELVRERYPVVAEVPFNSSNKWAMKIVEPPKEEDPRGELYYVLLKGAPEIVLKKCTTYMKQRQEHPINETFREEFKVAYERFASQGQRVLGCAMSVVKRSDLPEFEHVTESETLSGLTFVGLVSLMDPPREGVAEAIDSCFNASIRVFMVTGDHAFTAEAIARKVGIISLPTRGDLAVTRGVPVSEIDPRDEEIGAAIVSGSELYGMTDEQWETLLAYEQLVFARTTPTQKLEIVKRCQAGGEVVAVTGDGVNDSPALRRADIGVAMGSVNASDVAREAADIVLADDNFASIVNACEEGRVLFDNLKKTIAYTLSHLLPEILPSILFLAFGFPLGLSPLQVLSIDLGTELLPAMSLAYESAEDNIMDRPPRDMGKDRLVNRPMLVYSYAVVGLLESIICFLAYLFVFIDNGVNLSDLPFSSGDHWEDDSEVFVSDGKVFDSDDQIRIVEEARAAWYINLILCQLFHIWFVRSRFVSIRDRCKEINGVMIAGGALAVSLMIIFVYVPFMQPIFTTSAVDFVIWLPSLIFAVLIFILSEGCKHRARQGKEICKVMVKSFVF